MTMLQPDPRQSARVPDAGAPAIPDCDLVERVRAGDDAAFELIMRRHNRRLFRLARSFLGNDAEAEDVLQEAYVRAYAKLPTLVDGEALGAWLARLVANEDRKAQRRESVR